SRFRSKTRTLAADATPHVPACCRRVFDSFRPAHAAILSNGRGPRQSAPVVAPSPTLRAKRLHRMDSGRAPIDVGAAPAPEPSTLGLGSLALAMAGILHGLRSKQTANRRTNG